MHLCVDVLCKKILIYQMHSLIRKELLWIFVEHSIDDSMLSKPIVGNAFETVNNPPDPK